MNQAALNTLIRFATDGIDSRPVEDQIEIYQALAQVLPNKNAQIIAGRVAFAIQETTKLQMDFLSSLNGPKP